MGCDNSKHFLWITNFIISIRAPLCGVRQGYYLLISEPWGFQSAHPYVGCDCRRMDLPRGGHDFNPRTPMWGATSLVGCKFCPVNISIRAPLCGVRRCMAHPLGHGHPYFNPRTPMWGATNQPEDPVQMEAISIRAPLCGVRPWWKASKLTAVYFNPRTPMWGATRPGSQTNDDLLISIRAPLCGVRQRHNE